MFTKRFKNCKSRCITAEKQPRATATRNAKSVPAGKLKSQEICCGKAKELQRAAAILAAKANYEEADGPREPAYEARKPPRATAMKTAKACPGRGMRAPRSMARRLRGHQEPRVERTTTKKRRSIKWPRVNEAAVFKTISRATPDEM